jgi:hypothetical protein
VNKHLWTANKGCLSILGLGAGVTTCHHKGDVLNLKYPMLTHLVQKLHSFLEPKTPPPWFFPVNQLSSVHALMLSCAKIDFKFIP